MQHNSDHQFLITNLLGTAQTNFVVQLNEHTGVTRRTRECYQLLKLAQAIFTLSFFSSHLFPTESPSVLLAPAQSKSRRLAANACWPHVSGRLTSMGGKKPQLCGGCLELLQEPAPSGTETFWACALLGLS